MGSRHGRLAEVERHHLQSASAGAGKFPFPLVGQGKSRGEEGNDPGRSVAAGGRSKEGKGY